MGILAEGRFAEGVGGRACGAEGPASGARRWGPHLRRGGPLPAEGSEGRDCVAEGPPPAESDAAETVVADGSGRRPARGAKPRPRAKRAFARSAPLA
jgi:hypothetical protein